MSKVKTDWEALRDKVKATDKEVLRKVVSSIEGHEIYNPEGFIEMGLDPEIANAFLEEIHSDFDDPKWTITNKKGQVVKSMKGIYGLRLLEFIASVFDVTSWKIGRGSRADHLIEQLLAQNLKETE